MKSKIFLVLAIVSIGAYSCVSPKKLQESEAKVAQLNGAYAELQTKLRDAEDALNKSKAAAEKAKAAASAPPKDRPIQYPRTPD